MTTKTTKIPTQRSIYTPASTVRPNVCPICGIVEYVQPVSPRSRRRDVSQDCWELTLLGQALLDGLRALQHGGKPDA